jgi:hypothetical protein
MNEVLDEYINLLFEGAQTNLNAPEFAYYTLYDKKPEPNMLRGRTGNHNKKIIDGIEIDTRIPNKTIKKLFEIDEIEMRSSCQGESDIRPSFIIFRPNNQKKKYVKKLVENLNNQDDIRSKYDIGRKEKKFRICVTGNTWAGKKGNTKWWLSLPDKIYNSL